MQEALWSTKYDDNNPLAVQLRYVAQMISGGLQTKVYILNINGFDTHDSQVDTDTTTGNHADLLKRLSDAVEAFQDDLGLLGIEQKVAGMTYSEFGRQIQSNASNGTDHGDAAPLIMFGACLSANVLGPNPVISSSVPNQAGVPMQIDFRDVYASVLSQWFLVDETEIQTMFEHNVIIHNVLGACNLGVDENELEVASTAMVYPNPAYSLATLKMETLNESVSVQIYDIKGSMLFELFNKQLTEGEHQIPVDVSRWSKGAYIIKIRKESGNQNLKLTKI